MVRPGAGPAEREGVMQEHVPVGVVTKDGDRYVGTCGEVGTTVFGRTVAEAFAKLREATWNQLKTQGAATSCAGVER